MAAKACIFGAQQRTGRPHCDSFLHVATGVIARNAARRGPAMGCCRQLSTTA